MKDRIKDHYLVPNMDQMLHKVVGSKIWSSLSLGRCGKLAPRFCGPFEIFSKKGLVAYELALPAYVRVHNVFHASLLNKYFYDTKHVIDWSLL